MQLKIHQHEIDAISDLKRVSLTSSSHFFVSAFSMFLIKERKLSRSRLNSALVYTLVAITYNGGKVKFQFESLFLQWHLLITF